METLTIDRILADRRRDQDPELYGMDKSASARPPHSSSQYSDEEIEKMACLLKEAEVQEPSSGSDFNEKIAAALILSQSINHIVKEAESYSESENKEDGKAKDKKKEEDEEDENESKEEKTASMKVASLIVKAEEMGHSDDEIRGFLEKHAKAKGFYQGLKSLLSSKPAKATGAVGALAGAGVGGREYGQAETEEKAQNALKRILPRAFQAGQAHGYQTGAKRGYRAGAQATHNAWKKNIKQRVGSKES